MATKLDAAAITIPVVVVGFLTAFIFVVFGGFKSVKKLRANFDVESSVSIARRITPRFLLDWFDYLNNKPNHVIQGFYLSFVIVSLALNIKNFFWNWTAIGKLNGNWTFVIQSPIVGWFGREAEISKYHRLAALIAYSGCIVWFLLGCRVDPGTIRKVKGAKSYEDQVAGARKEDIPLYKYVCDKVIFREEKFCKTCQLWRPARAKHCKVCNRCVARSDHHCSWINNCVGQRNYFFFLGFVCWHFCVLIYGVYMHIIAVWAIWERTDVLRLLGDLSSKGTPMTTAMSKALQHSFIQYPLIFGSGFFHLACCFIALSFGGWHLFKLAGRNVTTNELYKRQEFVYDVKHGYIQFSVPTEDGKTELMSKRDATKFSKKNHYNKGWIRNYIEIIQNVQMIKNIRKSAKKSKKR